MTASYNLICRVKWSPDVFRLDSCLKKGIYSKIKYNNKQSEKSFAFNRALTDDNKNTDGHSLFEYRANIHLQGSFYPFFLSCGNRTICTFISAGTLPRLSNMSFHLCPCQKRHFFKRWPLAVRRNFSVSIVSKHLCRPLTFLIKNLFMLSVRISSSGSRRKFVDHEKCVRVARGAAESNSSFLSALQTSRVHP